jgi:cytochrome c
MDSFELNKIIGAILGTLLFVMGAGFLAEAIYAPIEDRGPGYALPEAEAAGDHGGEVVAVVRPDIGTLLASANAEQGAAAISKCKGCHNFEQGAGNKQGPELFGVVGRQIASHEGFAYGDALAAMGAAGDTWTYENLDAFLFAPRDFAPASKMNFGGLKNDLERANIIAYLASDTPGAPPFPAPAPAADATAEADTAAEATAETEAGATPAAEGEAAVPTEAEAIATPTETQSDTPVEGTAASAPAGEAPATEAPAATQAPATEAPATTPSP